MPAPLIENDLLEVICDAWRTVLSPTRVTVDDDLFSLGGTSLAAAEIAAYLTKELGVHVSVGDVLAAGNVKTLASVIATAEKPAGIHEHDQPINLDPSPYTPATVQQQAIWFLEEFESNKGAFDSISAVFIEGSLRIELMERALRVLINRHASLRTIFPTREGILVQEVREQGVLELDRLEAGEARPEEVESMLAGLGRHPFDVQRLPLIRWTLVRLTRDRWILAQVEHHFVHDAWSMWILFTELAAIYRSLSTAEHLELPPLELDYETYGRWQSTWLESAEATRQCRWWAELLSDVPTVFRFPNDERRPSSFSYEGGTVTARLPEALRVGVFEAAARMSVTRFSVFISAFAVLLGMVSGIDRFVLGSSLRNRRLRGSERVVGMFVNAIALRIDGWMELSFNDFANKVFGMLIAAQDRAEIPFAVVARQVGWRRDPSRNPIFQVCFSMNEWSSQDLDFGSAVGTGVSYPSNGTAKFDLDVVIDDPDECSFLWRYYRPLFSRQDVVDMARRYEGVLSECLDGGNSSLREVMGI